MLGEEFISINHGLKFSSIIKSYPNNSAEFFLAPIISATLFNDHIIISFYLAKISSKAKSFPVLFYYIK